MTIEDDDEGFEMEVLGLLSKKAEKRDDTARYMAQYRKEKKAEMARLKDAVARLTQQRDILAKAPRALPWTDVAHALADARRLAESQQKAMKHQLKQHESLMRAMAEWVALHTPVQTHGLDGSCLTWRDVSLMAEPTARRLGKEWIVKRLVHNMDQVFQLHAFPSWDSSDEIAWHMQYVPHENGYSIVTRRYYQNRTHGTMEEAVAWLFKSLLSFQSNVPQYDHSLPLVLDEGDGTSMRQCAVSIPANNHFCNVLAAHVRLAPNRSRNVIQEIHDDELCERVARGRHRVNRTMHVETFVRPSDQTMWERVLHVTSYLHPQNVDGVNPLDQDARVCGFTLDDCPPHLKESRFVARWQEGLFGRIRRLRQEQPPA
ncbi:Aste57867_25120 [Aphanomyces stellatus]|uniref:Aste57867_25120 protein n=1 Tax=Aphanomyces stellatus TaxID=120398 RepID=A0A485LUG2_9STRA|nr:hypothetical protein As57867_025042 [Aphanomyces stellatus]VFU01751.1 Aste57867_25120 [Aphanomyces stellatus]